MESPHENRFLAAFALLAFLMSVVCTASAQSRLVVDCGHDWGVGFYRDVSPSAVAGVDVDGDGQTSDDVARGWPYSISTPLSPSEPTYDSQLPSARFYGGVYAAIANRVGTSANSAPSEGHINQNHELRDDWNLMALPSQSLSPELESYEAAGVWLWKKEDFLNGGNQTTVSFAAPEDYIAVFISRYWGGVNWGRWVIQNNGQFYVSEPTFGNVTHQVKVTYDANNNIIEDAGVRSEGNPVYKTGQTVHPTQVRWAPYDPARPAPRAMSFDWLDSPDYQYRTFDDVQSVGFMVQRDLSVGAQTSLGLTLKEPIAVKWNAVRVQATLAAVADSAVLDLAPVGGGSDPQLWASRTEVTYRDWLRVQRWAISNQRVRNFTDGTDHFLPAYSFERDGAIGSAEASLASEHSPLEPVTTISWYDAIIWCNALSELEGREPAYYADAAFTTPIRKVFRRNLPRQSGSSVTGTRDDRQTVYWKQSAVGYRLPTETEWKSLAAGADDSNANAWTSANANNKTQPVATRAANSLGLHDMVGNASEYIWDAPGTISDPASQTQHKVLGGGFAHPADENAASLLPFAHRPWSGTYSVGFRPVRNGAGGLASGSGTFAERTISNSLQVPPTAPMSEEALRILVRSTMPLVEVAGAGSLAPGSTNVSLQTTSAYDVEVGTVEIPYTLWIRVKQWAETAHGYKFNFSGDMGSARHNIQLARGPNEPVTQVSWFDAVLWCNALSELMGLEPVYLDNAGNVEREVPPFRLTDYNTYAYPNLGQHSASERPEIDTALIGYTAPSNLIITRILPNPIRTGYRLPTGDEARAFAGTAYAQSDALNKTTTAFGWFRDDPSFGGNSTLLKAMPVGTKSPKPGANGIHDVLGNVQEWTFGGDGLGGQYRFGNDFGFASTTYPHTMNRKDHISSARAYLGFRVMKVKGEGNLPPSFEADPLLRADAYAGLPYGATIAASATDPNPGDTLTYSKTAGPSWLAVATDGTLTGTPGAGDAGTQTFQVTATDFAGLSTSVSLRIEVRNSAVAPQISPSAGTLEGRVDVTLTTPTPGCTYRYTTDGSDPAPAHGAETSGTFTLLPPAGALVLKVIAIHPSLYPSPVSSATYTITPGSAPQISLQPQSQRMGSGADITLTVGSTGTAPLLYQWRRNGIAITGATGASCLIPSAGPASTGHYSVVVSNDFGSATSGVAEVIVRDGFTGDDPDVEVTPADIQISALADTTSQHGLVIGNAGGSPLNWTLSIPPVSGGNYTIARSTSGGPAMAWRDNVGTDKGGTKVSFSNTDDGATSVAFTGSFTFPFYGTSYAAAFICTNGFITFNGSSTAYTNTALPGTSAPARMIAALWDDLNADASAGVWWRQDADAFVITWHNISLYANSASRQTFQMLLFADGSVRCQYLSLNSATSTTVGMQNTTTTGLQAAYNSTTPPTAGEAITFSQSFSWAPTASLLSGTVGSFAQQLVTLTANTTGLAVGDTRSVQLTLTSNDPDTPTLVIPVALTVVSSLVAPAILTPARLPGAVAGAPYATKLLHRSGNGTVDWSLVAGLLPAGLALSADGWISGTPAAAGTASFTAQATDDTPSSATRAFTLAVTPAFPPLVTSTGLSDAQVSVPYSVTLTASDGLAPLTWSATAPVPAGLSLGANGVLSGTPVEDGNYLIAIRVSDASDNSADAVLDLTILPPPALAISTSTLVEGLRDAAYSLQLGATGGYGNNTWSVGGLLPAGMSFSSGGLLSGTPTAAGITPLHFTVTDRRGNTTSRDLGLVVSATIPGRPTLEAGGWNIHDVTYWNQSQMFADLMKSSSGWQHNWADFSYTTDTRGYPTVIPAGNTPGAKVTIFEPGQYVLTWRGAGLVKVESGATLVSEDLSGAVKRRVYEKTTPITTAQLTRIQILDQVPATDIHLWAPGLEPAAGATATVFHPDFLERLKDNSAVIRFMSWGEANNATHPVWSDRRRADYFNQNSPTAYEEMVALCNTADKDMWVCIPHTVMDADPTYVAKLAQLILTGTDGGVQVCEPLKPGLKVYVEWSNEVWNSSFPQFTWVVDKAKARLGVTTLPDFNEVWKIIGEYHATAFKVFRDEFAAAGRPHGQLVRVLASQIGGSLATYHMRGVAAVAAADPGAAADYQPDVLAVGAYFGHDLDDWVVANVPAPGSATAVEYDAAFDALRESVTGAYATGIRSSASAAAAQGLNLIAYEGGQHVVGSGANSSNTGLTTFLTTMNRDPRMGPLITLSLDIWEQSGGGLFVAFCETGPYGSFGSWGFREFWYQTLAEAPKAAAFTDWMRRMQQGHLLDYEVPDGYLGYGYTNTLGIVPLGASPTCSLSSGALPPGLLLAGNGTISGIPLDYGDFTFGVTLDNGGGLTDTREYLVSIGTGRPSPALPPVADAHAYSAAGFTTTNYGTSTALATHLPSLRYSHIRWDLSAFAGKTITRATLRLNRVGSTTATTASLAAYTPESEWGELSISWADGRPALGSTIATFPVSASSAPHSVDVTGWASVRAGSSSAGFALLTDQYAAWSSKEASTGGPTLVVESEPDAAITTRWENWSMDNLGSASTDPSADTDADGLNNLAEYALRTDPLAADVTAPGVLLPSGNGWIFRLPFHPGQRDRRVRVMASSDLQSWNTVVFDSATDGGSLPFQWNTVDIDVSGFGGRDHPRTFFRIQIEQLP